MAQFRCVIQEQGVAQTRREELERRLHEHHNRHYPGEETTVRWTAVPAGHMFTEGRQSTSSVVSCTLAHTTTREGREHYMRGVCELWTEVAQCTDHEVVVSITESVGQDQE